MIDLNPFRSDAKGLQFRLFLLYLLFVIYGSLVPLRYVDRTWIDAFDAFRNIPFLELGIQSRADWVANYLLFIPLTFLASMALNSAGAMSRRLLIAGTLVMLAVCLAVGIEFTQLFFPQRTVSQNDILAESLGGMFGVAAHFFLGARSQAWFDGFSRAQQAQDRGTTLLRSYLFILFVFNVLPLDLTLSPVEIYHKWKEGRVIFIPFAGITEEWSTSLYGFVTDVAVWVPAGILWALRSRRSFRQILLLGLFAAGSIELLQLFVFSRTTDVTDVLLGVCGVLLGAVLLRRTRPYLPAVTSLFQRQWLTLWMCWAIFVLCVFWFPFQFNFEGVSGKDILMAFTRMPFYTYYFGSEYHAVNELLRKIGFFLPAGVILGIAATMREGGRSSGAVRAHLGLLFILALLVEAGQLALPGKVADLTDVLLEFFGGWLGYKLAHWVCLPGLTSHPEKSLEVRTQDISTQVGLDMAGWLPGWRHHVAFIATFAAVLYLLLTSSIVPYNLRELIPSGVTGAVSAIALCLVIYAMANSVFLFDALLSRFWLWLLPGFLICHSVISWVLLQLSVPEESMHDIVGSPTLGWSWDWELLARYVALHTSLLLQLVGAALLVQSIIRPVRVVYFLGWVLLSATLAWPLYTVVVTQAATDNLTELMANDASFLSASLLAMAVFLTSVSASALSAALNVRRKGGVLFSLASLAMAGASACYWWGAEHVILKYGRVFSAFQFLLSTDRDHYSQGSDLTLRFAALLGLMCGGLAIMQWLSWRRFTMTSVSLRHSAKVRSRKVTRH